MEWFTPNYNLNCIILFTYKMELENGISHEFWKSKFQRKQLHIMTKLFTSEKSEHLLKMLHTL